MVEEWTSAHALRQSFLLQAEKLNLRANRQLMIQGFSVVLEAVQPQLPKIKEMVPGHFDQEIQETCKSV